MDRQYDIEVQRADAGARPEWARYHSAAMDIEALDAGQDFEDLPDSYTIFVTERDFFGAGMGLYSIERVNMGTGALFGDREHILYVNGQYHGDDPLGRLMHDFLCCDPDDMHYGILADRTRYYKENPKGVSEMCKAMEDMRNEALELGREEGRMSMLIKTFQSLKRRMGWSDQQAREALDISDEDWNRIAAKV